MSNNEPIYSKQNLSKDDNEKYGTYNQNIDIIIENDRLHHNIIEFGKNTSSSSIKVLNSQLEYIPSLLNNKRVLNHKYNEIKSDLILSKTNSKRSINEYIVFSKINSDSKSIKTFEVNSLSNNNNNHIKTVYNTRFCDLYYLSNSFYFKKERNETLEINDDQNDNEFNSLFFKNYKNIEKTRKENKNINNISNISSCQKLETCANEITYEYVDSVDFHNNQNIYFDENRYYDSIPYVGLINNKNTCYVNSIVQTLFFTIPFKNSILINDIYDLEQDNDKNTVYQIKVLFIKLMISSCSESTKNLLKSLDIDKEFLNHQQDIQEFYNIILRKIHENEYDNYLYSYFKGKVETSIKCLKCLNTSCKTTDFIDIQLPLNNGNEHNDHKNIEKKISLKDKDSFFQEKSKNSYNIEYTNPSKISDLLHSFEKYDILKDENSYYCNHCQRKVSESQKNTKIIEYPNILVLHLNRIIYDNSYRIKVKNPILIEDYILTNRNVYKLYSVIVHIGNSDSGHYVSFLYSFDYHLWYKFNDEKISLSVFSEVLESSLNNAYMLFYQKVEIEQFNSFDKYNGLTCGIYQKFSDIQLNKISNPFKESLIKFITDRNDDIEKEKRKDISDNKLELDKKIFTILKEYDSFDESRYKNLEKFSKNKLRTLFPKRFIENNLHFITGILCNTIKMNFVSVFINVKSKKYEINNMITSTYQKNSCLFNFILQSYSKINHSINNSSNIFINNESKFHIYKYDNRTGIIFDEKIIEQEKFIDKTSTYELNILEYFMDSYFFVIFESKNLPLSNICNENFETLISKNELLEKKSNLKDIRIFVKIEILEKDNQLNFIDENIENNLSKDKSIIKINSNNRIQNDFVIVKFNVESYIKELFSFLENLSQTTNQKFNSEKLYLMNLKLILEAFTIENSIEYDFLIAKNNLQKIILEIEESLNLSCNAYENKDFQVKENCKNKIYLSKVSYDFNNNIIDEELLDFFLNCKEINRKETKCIFERNIELIKNKISHHSCLKLIKRVSDDTEVEIFFENQTYKYFICNSYANKTSVFNFAYEKIFSQEFFKYNEDMINYNYFVFINDFTLIPDLFIILESLIKNLKNSNKKYSNFENLYNKLKITIKKVRKINKELCFQQYKKTNDKNNAIDSKSTDLNRNIVNKYQILISEYNKKINKSELISFSSHDDLLSTINELYSVNSNNIKSDMALNDNSNNFILFRFTNDYKIKVLYDYNQLIQYINETESGNKQKVIYYSTDLENIIT